MPAHVARSRGHTRAVRPYTASTLRAVAHAGARAGGALRRAYKEHVARKHKKVPKVVKRVDAEQVTHSALNSNNIQVKAKGKVKLLKKQRMMGHWRYQQTNQNIISSGEGSQSCQLIQIGNSLPQQTVTSGAGYALYQNAVALQQLNPYAGNTGSTVLAAQIPLEDRFVIKRMEFNIDFTNFEPVGAYIDVFLLKVKKYCNESPDSDFSTGFVKEAFGQAVNAPGSTVIVNVRYCWNFWLCN